PQVAGPRLAWAVRLEPGARLGAEGLLGRGEADVHGGAINTIRRRDGKRMFDSPRWTRQVAPVQPRDRFIESNRLRHHLLEWGGRGPGVLLPHGVLEHPPAWDPLAP